jgi:hypothetical protein
MATDRPTRDDIRRARLTAQKAAEDAGQVADSLTVRMQLIARMKSGEISFDEMQAELKRIKRSAKAAGQFTREQAYYSRG